MSEKLKYRIRKIFQDEDEIRQEKVEDVKKLHEPDYTEEELEEGKKKKKIHKTKRGRQGYIIGPWFGGDESNNSDSSGEGGE